MCNCKLCILLIVWYLITFISYFLQKNLWPIPVCWTAVQWDLYRWSWVLYEPQQVQVNLRQLHLLQLLPLLQPQPLHLLQLLHLLQVLLPLPSSLLPSWWLSKVEGERQCPGLPAPRIRLLPWSGHLQSQSRQAPPSAALCPPALLMTMMMLRFPSGPANRLWRPTRHVSE